MNKLFLIEHRGSGDILSSPPAEYAKWLWDAYIRQNSIALLAGHGESGKVFSAFNWLPVKQSATFRVMMAETTFPSYECNSQSVITKNLIEKFFQ